MNAEQFNALYPIGTPVVAYPGCRPEDDSNDERLVTRTRSKAEVLGGHTDVVWVDGHEACVALTHIDPVPACRCDEPDADPYACEADDCTARVSELNPFGGGPVHGHDAKVSRPCGQCDYRTSVWHVDDGSAEEELHGHVLRVHGGVAAGVAR